MPTVVSFPAPRRAELVEEPSQPLGARQVRVRTEHSGISAGTELTAYRGHNPYLQRRWDPASRLFRSGSQSLTYPVVGWGYEEVGVVTDVGAAVTGIEVGARVWGSWGHRSETVLEEDVVTARRLPSGTDPVAGVFAKIGAIALNAVHDAAVRVGDTVAVHGLGVPGQLVVSLAGLAGARVVAVDPDPQRRAVARQRGAELALDPLVDDVPGALEQLCGPRRADAAIEIAGVAPALHEAIRCVGHNGRVVVSGFHQGEAAGLRLGEEFHHNRVTLVSSQISGTSAEAQHRWDELRLSRTVLDLVAAGRLDVTSLVTHRFAAERAGEAFTMVDQPSEHLLQVVLDFDGAVA